METVSGAARIRKPGNFGKRRELPTITIERAGKRRQFKLSITALAITFSVLAMFSVGYFSATAYLFLRHDLLALSNSRNAQLVREYENRIAAMRSDIDRLTSTKLVRQQTLEEKVELLLRRQAIVESKSNKIKDLLEKAREAGIKLDNERASLQKQTRAATALALRGGRDSISSQSDPLPIAVAAAIQVPDLSDKRQTEPMIASLLQRLVATEDAQAEAIAILAEKSGKALEDRIGVLKKLNLTDGHSTAIGGPFVPTGSGDSGELAQISDAIERLEKVNKKLAHLPLARPARTGRISSAFGKRVDPFLGRIAMHSGIDFAAKAGSSVYAAGDGVVIEAGWNGGYGKTVVIDHGSGLTSQYAHLQRITISTGQSVKKGTRIGRVGSTGRSTGPHLHYEIHRGGQAQDPAKFLNAGRQLEH